MSNEPTGSNPLDVIVPPVAPVEVTPLPPPTAGDPAPATPPTLGEVLDQLDAANKQIAEQEATIDTLSKHALELQAELEAKPAASGEVTCPTCGTRIPKS